MKFCRTSVFVVALLLLAVRFQAQTFPIADASPAAGGNSATTDSAAPASGEQLLTPKLLLLHIGSDQKRIWLFPVAPVHGRHWKPVLAIVGVTAALVALDPHDTPFSRAPPIRGMRRFTASVTF